MKTKLNLIVGLGLLFSSAIHAQTNYTVNLPVNHQVTNLYGPVCCFMKVNVASDDGGNAYVLSEVSSDSSIWVTKYDNNGNQVFQTRTGVLGFETNYRYFAKKIRVYGDRVYVLCTTIFDPAQGQQQTIYVVDRNTGALTSTVGFFGPVTGYTTSELVDLVQDGSTVFIA